MKLTFEDNFETDGALDPISWHVSNRIESGHERKLHTNTDRLKNVRKEGGQLIIEAHRESFRDGKDYTSGWATTRFRRYFKYGAFEAQCWLPEPPGTWPGFWLMPRVGRWPDAGEIDIMESVKSRTHVGAHFVRLYKQKKGTSKWQDRAWRKRPHVFRAEWDEEMIRWLMDGSEIYRLKAWAGWPFDKQFYIILNMDIGGWGGDPGGTSFPQQYRIDYVRAWSDQETPVPPPPPPPPPLPPPVNGNKKKLEDASKLIQEVADTLT